MLKLREVACHISAALPCFRGAISFQDLRAGIHQLPGGDGLHLTREEFHLVQTLTSRRLTDRLGAYK